MAQTQPKPGTPTTRSGNPKSDSRGRSDGTRGGGLAGSSTQATSDHYPNPSSANRESRGSSTSVPGPVTSTEAHYTTKTTRGSTSASDATVNPDGSRRVRTVKTKY